MLFSYLRILQHSYAYSLVAERILMRQRFYKQLDFTTVYLVIQIVFSICIPLQITQKNVTSFQKKKLTSVP